MPREGSKAKGGGSARPCVSVPAPLLDAYEAARDTPEGRGLPGLSELLQERMRALLLDCGFPVPPLTTPPRTAAATRARWSKKSTREPSRGS